MSPVAPTIRPESAADVAAIHRVNAAAFGQPDEADLVDTLRDAVEPFISLVAVDGRDVVGHIAFSPVTVEGAGDLDLIMGLAPMAVDPVRQNRGIGTALVKSGLDACRVAGAAAVVVLGHPEYYPRFGFRPASRFGLSFPADVPDEAFMAMELEPGALADVAGIVHYAPPFAALP